MANLTISVDEEVLRRARIRALELGVSVNAVLSEYLEVFSGTRESRQAAAGKLLKISSDSKSSRGRAEWSREELHERG